MFDQAGKGEDARRNEDFGETQVLPRSELPLRRVIWLPPQNPLFLPTIAVGAKSREVMYESRHCHSFGSHAMPFLPAVSGGGSVSIPRAAGILDAGVLKIVLFYT